MPLTPRRGAALAAACLVGVSVLAAPSAFAADGLGANGGATRNSDDKIQMIKDSVVDGPAKNVILLIGDGMGDSEITIARNYEYGAEGQLPGIDALPLTGSYTTYSLYRDEERYGLPDYVPDSAATGSAWATGTKTYDNAISVDIDGTPQDTLIEIAKANGKKTGNVSTAEIQDATPAVQAAHVDARSFYGPESENGGDDYLELGGLGSISEQIIGTRADLTLGGGSKSFLQSAKAGDWAGETLFDQAADRGYQVVDSADELDAVTEADQTSPVLGTFTEGNFPTRFAATQATVGGGDLEPVSCETNPERLTSDLSLASLTSTSIGLLNTGDEGFFLQVEGASIDKQDHAANACGQIGETIDLDEAVQVALDFAKKDGNTMVIVTADHGHTSQIVDSTPPATLSTALRTTEGSVMKVAYGTAAAEGSQQHTGTQVRIAGYGPGAAAVVGLTDQTDNFFTIANALTLDRDLDAFSADAVLSAPTTPVAPGGSVAISASGLEGDRQVTGTAGDTAIGTTDVIDGGVSLALTAPSEPGEYSVALTGAQSGTALTASFTVAAGAPATATPTPEPTPSSTAPAAAAPWSGTSGGGSGLAFTGADVAPFAFLAAFLLLAGAGLTLVRRKRHHA
ncbi:alkaline phosphatase [Rathayibacter sp. VKM Ac-2759]|uniref:alkaline phosphatase n=1 Tax=Rathayibacter sp. VKM Ac-2759 TaxID=2609252 RepID=UPI001317A0AC|nr:alkaline phosphatase [Rathayibacter sp. VKM Ac-2759]QHC68156.1 alkaline phosphatase [Rathayibacter sp. VKM Ac-2759]